MFYKFEATIIFIKLSCSDTLMKATVLASCAASCLTRRCSYLAFEKMNRHMTASDMIDQIPRAFSQLFSS